MSATNHNVPATGRALTQYWYVLAIFATLGAGLGAIYGTSISKNSSWIAETTLSAPRFAELQDLITLYSAPHAISIAPNLDGETKLNFPHRELPKLAFEGFVENSIRLNGQLAASVFNDEILEDARVFARLSRDGKDIHLQVVSRKSDPEKKLIRILELLSKQCATTLLNDTYQYLSAIETHLKWFQKSSGSLSTLDETNRQRISRIKETLIALRNDKLTGSFFRESESAPLPRKLEVRSQAFWSIMGAFIGLFAGLAVLANFLLITQSRAKSFSRN
jgi:hypothetical protein